MFSGWSTAGSGSGGSSGGGWSTGSGGTTSTSGGGWTTGSGGGSSSGGWSFAPTVAPTYTPIVAPTYTPSYASYIPGGTVQVLPTGAGLQFGPYGEGGPYTPLEYPLLHELKPGQRLEAGSGGIVRSGWLLFGVLALALLASKKG